MQRGSCRIMRVRQLHSGASTFAMVTGKYIQAGARVTFDFLRQRTAADDLWTAFDLERLGHLAVPAVFDGVPVRAVIDTGATRSVISPSLVRRLGLQPAGIISASLVTSQTRVPLYRTGELTIGSARVRGLEVASRDLAALGWGAPGEMTALIGQDVLAQSVLDLHFSCGRLRVRGGSLQGTDGFEALDVQKNAFGLQTISVVPEDLAPQRAVVDLGNDFACLVSESYAKEAGLLARKSSTSLSADLGGAVISRVVSLRTLRLGNHLLRSVPVSIVPDWTLDVPINLGWPAFAAFDLSFRHGREIWLRADADRLSRPLQRDRSGIGGERLSDLIVIRHVAQGSPAARAGLLASERIAAINGRAIDKDFPAPGQRFGSAAAGTVLALTLDDSREVRLVLEDYY